MPEPAPHLMILLGKPRVGAADGGEMPGDQAPEDEHGKRAMAEELISAIHARDGGKVAQLLEDFFGACDMDEDEEGPEEAGEDEGEES